MISVTEFLSCVQKNVDRIHEYALGGDGAGGKCDCIGLIIGALRLAGLSWPWTHGSNYAARFRMRTLTALNGESVLFPGQVVYKAREPGQEGYDLPEQYQNGPDLRDYYHAGVVTSVSPLLITHCTGVPGGIQVDSALGKWNFGGQMDQVDYDGADDPLYQAMVTADNTAPVRLRAQPSTKSAVLASIPQGELADVLEEVNADWSRIRVNGLVGYMMRKFLKPMDGSDTVCLSRAEAEEILSLMEQAARLLSDLVARTK